MSTTTTKRNSLPVDRLIDLAFYFESQRAVIASEQWTMETACTKAAEHMGCDVTPSNVKTAIRRRNIALAGKPRNGIKAGGRYGRVIAQQRILAYVLVVMIEELKGPTQVPTILRDIATGCAKLPTHWPNGNEHAGSNSNRNLRD